MTLAPAAIVPAKPSHTLRQFRSPRYARFATVRIDWGDGTGTTTLNLAAGTLNFGNLNHIFANQGTYTLQATVTDKDGDAVGNSQTVVVKLRRRI